MVLCCNYHLNRAVIHAWLAASNLKKIIDLLYIITALCHSLFSKISRLINRKREFCSSQNSLFQNLDILERMYQSLPEDTGSAGTIVSTGAGASAHADNIMAPKSATTVIFTLFILNPYSLISAHIVTMAHITH